MPKAGERLDEETLRRNFADWPPPLGPDEARLEASRCLFCHDAPCTRACPTHIDVPRFIRQILHRDAAGAARTILEANIFGGSCARACPTEVLCEGACVESARVRAPVQIGRLQRYACDHAAARGLEFFAAGPPSGKRVAVVGAGPAGLACAHELRKHGHAVVVFEARDVAGGLNTLGIAAYKISTRFALSEVERVERLGVEVRLGHRVDATELARLLDDHGAVFLGLGLGPTRDLGIPGEELPGVWEALAFISQTHTRPLAECEIGRRVVVLGGGNTAVDVATEAVRLGAERVTIAYRRGPEATPAFRYEVELARADGVRFEWHVEPVRIVAEDGAAAGVELRRVEAADPASRRSPLRALPDSGFVMAADLVVKALGQAPLLEFLRAVPGLEVEDGRVAVDPETGATSVPGLFAGGDCISRGAEIVHAVQQGKIAARAIDRRLREG